MISINISNIGAYADTLNAGDEVLLSGTIYTARDAAHKRLAKLLDEGKTLPFKLNEAVIYYAGPTPAPDNRAIGSIGPTTSGRMDYWTPRLLDLGLVAMIGKGQRSREVNAAIVRNHSPYFIAIGGAGALYAKHVVASKIIAFEDLGCEAIRELTVENFPVYVAIDCNGNSLFEH